MQQVFDDFQGVDNGVLRVVQGLAPSLIGASVEVVGKIGEKTFVEVVERVQKFVPLSAVVLQSFKRRKVGLAGTFNPSFSASVHSVGIFVYQFVEAFNRPCNRGVGEDPLGLNCFSDGNSREKLPLLGQMLVGLTNGSFQSINLFVYLVQAHSFAQVWGLLCLAPTNGLVPISRLNPLFGINPDSLPVYGG